MKIKKYVDFVLNEDVNLYVVKILEKLRDIYQPQVGKYYIDLMKDFHISFTIDLRLKPLDKIPLYNSNISIKEILEKQFDNFIIEIVVNDNIIDKNKIYSLLSHEISHVYQLLNDPDNKYFESFNKMIQIEDFKNTVLEYKSDFLDYIYFNFIHELDARVNQTYELYRYSNKNNLETILEDFEQSYLFKILMFIANFNSEKLINKWGDKNLLEITNQFNILYEIDKISQNQLKEYYDKWQKVFKKNSDEYLIKSKDAIKQAYDEIKRYEITSYCYDETIILENKYDIDIEILNLVSMFKKM
jgi:hypothetical protein